MQESSGCIFRTEEAGHVPLVIVTSPSFTQIFEDVSVDKEVGNFFGFSVHTITSEVSKGNKYNMNRAIPFEVRYQATQPERGKQRRDSPKTPGNGSKPTGVANPYEVHVSACKC